MGRSGIRREAKRAYARARPRARVGVARRSSTPGIWRGHHAGRREQEGRGLKRHQVGRGMTTGGISVGCSRSYQTGP